MEQRNWWTASATFAHFPLHATASSSCSGGASASQSLPSLQIEIAHPSFVPGSNVDAANVLHDRVEYNKQGKTHESTSLIEADRRNCTHFSALDREKAFSGVSDRPCFSGLSEGVCTVSDIRFPCASHASIIASVETKKKKRKKIEVNEESYEGTVVGQTPNL